jgi:sulfatase maturation enzyme AslB (radical SAM superfamily)
MKDDKKNFKVRKALTDQDGKRESENIINKDKDLSGRFCSRPFDFIEPHDLGVGKVFVCCPTWLNVQVGNLTEQSVYEAFNSEENQEIRKSILDGNFKYCNHKHCPMIQNDSLPKKEDILKREDFDPDTARHQHIIKNNITKDLRPIVYNLCYDESCNLACPSCRVNKLNINEGEKYERKLLIQSKIIEEVFGESHNRVCRVSVTGSGDPFGSKIFRELLFGIDGSKYPNVKINLQTNGVMFTEKYWDKMSRIHNNIDTVLISLDAGTEEAYKFTRRGGNWNAVMKNLEFISELKRHNKINYLRLDFVVQQKNYKEMVQFINIGKKFKVDSCYFSLVADWGTWSIDEYKSHAIWKTDHPEFNEFIETLKNPIFNDPIVDLGNLTEYKNYKN